MITVKSNIPEQTLTVNGGGAKSVQLNVKDNLNDLQILQYPNVDITVGVGDTTELNNFTSSIQLEVDSLTSVTGSYLTTLPSGTVSGSVQITNGSTLLSGSKTDISSLNTFTSSIQTEVDGISSATSSYLTTLPNGTVSGSTQITNASTILSGSKTNITSLNNFTSSIQTEVNGLSSVTGSYLTTLPNNLVSGSSQLTGSYDVRYQLSGSAGGADWNVNLDNIPVGIISGSTQITNGSTILSGSKTNITSLNNFTSSIQNEVDSLTSVTGSYLTTLPSNLISGSSQLTGSYDVRYQLSGSAGAGGADWNVNLDNIPSGIISGSSQITNGSTILSGSKTNITSLNNFTSSIQSEVDGISSVTGSYLTTLPSGTVSGSTQITNGSTILSGSKTNITSLNNFTSSIQTEVNGLSSVTGSYLTTLPSGTVSGSTQITNGSTILSGSKTNITHLNTFTSSIQTEVDGISSVTSSYLTTLPNNLVSGSTQITNGSTILSGSKTNITSLNNFTSSIQSEVDGISSVTGSYLTTLPSGTVSGSVQITNGSTILSGSKTNITSLNNFTSSIQTEVNGLSSVTSSYITTLPSGTVSGSTQITNGSTILSGSKTNITSLNNFTSSIQSEVDGLSAATSSYLTTLPSGTVSGSTQITNGSTLLSGSKTNITSLNNFTSSIQSEVDGITSVTGSYLTTLPTGTVSGSTQITNGSTILSGSKTDITSLNNFTSSIQTEVNGLSAATSSYVTTDTDTTYTAGTGLELTGTVFSQTPRTINGTTYNGSSNITTANWGTSRNISIGGTSKSVNGSGNVTWTAAEIGITKSAIDALNIDADTLDSLNSTQFLRSDQSDTINGNLTVTGTITAGGMITGTGTIPFNSLGTGLSSNNTARNFMIARDSANTLLWYIGMTSTSNNDVIINNYDGGAFLKIRDGGQENGLEYYNGSSTRTVWHSGNDGSLLNTSSTSQSKLGALGVKSLQSDWVLTGGNQSNANTVFSDYNVPARGLLVTSNSSSSTNYTSGFGQTLFINGGSDGRNMAIYKVFGGNNDYYLGNSESGAWNWRKIWTDGNDGAGSGLNAGLYHGFDITVSGNRWGVISPVETSGVIEIGRYIDFHNTDGSTADRTFRIDNSSTGFLNLQGNINVEDDLTVGGTITASQTISTSGNFETDSSFRLMTSNSFIYNDGQGGNNVEAGIRLNGASERVGIWTGSQERFWVQGNQAKMNGDITATSFPTSSDKRLKAKIKDLEIKTIPVKWKSFEFKTEKGQYRTGVIAQELEKTNPEFVRTDNEGMKSVSYTDLLIAKIAELEERLNKVGI